MSTARKGPSGPVAYKRTTADLPITAVNAGAQAQIVVAVPEAEVGDIPVVAQAFLGSDELILMGADTVALDGTVTFRVNNYSAGNLNTVLRTVNLLLFKQ